MYVKKKQQYEIDIFNKINGSFTVDNIHDTATSIA